MAMTCWKSFFGNTFTNRVLEQDLPINSVNCPPQICVHMEPTLFEVLRTSLSLCLPSYFVFPSLCLVSWTWRWAVFVFTIITFLLSGTVSSLIRLGIAASEAYVFFLKNALFSSIYFYRNALHLLKGGKFHEVDTFFLQHHSSVTIYSLFPVFKLSLVCFSV